MKKLHYFFELFIINSKTDRLSKGKGIMKEKRKEKILSGVLWALILAYGVFSTVLYYRQTFHTEGMPYESDLPYHISMAVDDHWFYSLTAILYQVFFLTPFGNLLTALFLGSVTVGTIAATKTLLQDIAEKTGIGSIPRPLFLLFGFLCNVAMPFYLPAAHYQRYIGYQSASIWHNSTYICMKFCGILVLILYLRLEPKYRNGLSLKEWVLLAGAFILVNSVKPSFSLVFLPVMALCLLADLFRKTPFIKIFLFGLTVIPSLLVILWQNAVLFGEETGNGIEIRYGYTLTLHSLHPKATLLLSIAFPLFVLIFLWKELLRDKWYRMSWLVWGAALVQVTFLSESGARARDGNFMWGYSFGIFMITIWSVVKLLETLKRPAGIFTKKWIRISFGTAGLAVFAYQCFCGFVFWIQLCQGVTYWM